MAPAAGAERPLPLAADSAELRDALEAVLHRAALIFARRADYGLIGQIKQKDDELITDFRPRFETVFRENSGLAVNDEDNGPYRQQLKNALVGAVHSGIREWVLKNYVGLSTGTLSECMNWLIHAEKVIKNKKKGKPVQKGQAETFLQDDSGEDRVFYSEYEQKDRSRGRGRGVYRGREKYGRRGRGQKQQNSEDGCLICGASEHWVRNCPERRDKRK